MQDDQRSTSSPTSRRPVTQIEEPEPDFASRDVAHSSQPPSSSQIWTSQPQSFSSYSSQEHDPHFQQPPQDQRFSIPPSSTFPHEPAVHYQASPTSYPQYYPVEDQPSSQVTRPTEPYATSSFPVSQMEVPESIGPPLPYPYVQHYPEMVAPSGEVRRQSLPEIPPRGRAQTSRHTRGRRVSPVEPYHVRRASHDLRSQPHSFDTSYTPAFRTPSRSPSRPASRTHQSYRSPSMPTSDTLFQYTPTSPMQQYHLGSLPSSRISQQAMPSQIYPSRPPAYFQPVPAHGYSHPLGMPTGIHSGSSPPFSRGPTPTYPHQIGARPLPNVGELTTIPSSYSIELPAPPRLEPRPPPPQPPSQPRRRHRAHPAPPRPPSPVHHLRTPAERRSTHPQQEPQKRRKPPDPYTSYANMLGDIIGEHPRKKMTLQDIYDYLKQQYPDHFPDDGLDDSKGMGSGGGWRNTVRHALSVNKWFKKQLRTDSDEKLDRSDPNRAEPPPIDNDEDAVAPATDHSYRRGEVGGGHRPLKGGYWFIREKYRDEIAAAIARDKEKWEETKYELEIEERERQFALSRQSRQPEHFQSRHPSPREHFQSRQPSPREHFQSRQPSPRQPFQSGQPGQPSPREHFQSRQPSPREHFQPRQPSPRETFRSGPPSPIQMFPSRQPSPRETFQSRPPSPRTAAAAAAGTRRGGHSPRGGFDPNAEEHSRQPFGQYPPSGPPWRR